MYVTLAVRADLLFSQHVEVTQKQEHFSALKAASSLQSQPGPMTTVTSHASSISCHSHPGPAASIDTEQGLREIQPDGQQAAPTEQQLQLWQHWAHMPGALTSSAVYLPLSMQRKSTSISLSSPPYVPNVTELCLQKNFLSDKGNLPRTKMLGSCLRKSQLPLAMLS